MTHSPRPLIDGLLSVALFVTVLLATALVGRLPAARACPFCSAVSMTFAQEIAQSQVAVIARLVEPPAATALSPRADGPLPKGRFDVAEVLKGGELLAAASPDATTGTNDPLDGTVGVRQIETIMLEVKPVGSLSLLMAVEPPKLVWSSPIPISDRGVEYLRKLAELPAKGADRLAFFQKYLEDEDDTLARDAYDEFAVAPYDDVRGLESRMDPTQLLSWIENPKVPANRRRLYATMLGVCGTKADADRIGAILTTTNPPPGQEEVRSGLDALIACYVTLKGPEGLDLVDTQFLNRKGRNVPFTETYAAVMALRFLGEESTAVPRERVLQSLRILLEEPKLADLVIADLARWEDWSSIDRLAELFEQADADNIFVREPVVNYLKSCPLPQAAEVLARLEKIDPEAVRRAATLAGFAGALAAKPPAVATPADDGDVGGTAAPTTPGESGDGGASSLTAPSAANPAGGTATAEDTQLSARIPQVLADEDATDDTAAIDPSRPQPAGGTGGTGSGVPVTATLTTPPTTGAAPLPAAPGERWGGSASRWLGWGLAALAAGVLWRFALRPSGAA